MSLEGDIEILVGRGSQEAAIKWIIQSNHPDDAENRIELAYDHLLSSTPSEMSGSWPMVIAWGRIQIAYIQAVAMGDIKMQLACAAASAQLVKDMY